MKKTPGDVFPLSPEERMRWESDGFVVRRGLLDQAELDELSDACEELCAQLVEYSDERRKETVSQYYVFEPDSLHNIILKWEPGDKRVLQGVEPAAHLHPTIMEYGHHPSMTEPCRELIGAPDVMLFTEKLNVKRAGVGGGYALHHDFPYWNGTAQDVLGLVTVLLALDAADAANGALEVLPGSHLMRDPPYKTDGQEFERAEMDPKRLDTTHMIPVELEAGDAVFFGPFLIHRSGENTSPRHRRAMLYTYQREGLKDQRDIFREWLDPGTNPNQEIR
jgi:2-aminoethylphosphonate dioxygenase